MNPRFILLFFILGTRLLPGSSMNCWTELSALVPNNNGGNDDPFTEMGYKACGAKEERCGRAVNVTVAKFLEMDGAKDSTDITTWIRRASRDKRGVVEVGMMCMSETDCTAIGAEAKEMCRDVEKACCCSGDGCTGGSGAATGLMGVIATLVFVGLAGF